MTVSSRINRFQNASLAIPVTLILAKERHRLRRNAQCGALCVSEVLATDRKSAAKFSSLTVTDDGVGSIRSGCCGDVCSGTGGSVLGCESVARIRSNGVIESDRSTADESCVEEVA
jgi:hypothetical protein